MAGAELCGFNFQSLIGKGGFGSVYRISIPGEGLKAFKYIPFPKSYEDTGVLDLTEVDVMRRVHHPNLNSSSAIITQGDCKEKLEGYGLVMPLARYTLHTLIYKDGYSIRERRQHLFQICCGLNFLHRNGILHLDLKPENVLILPDNRAVLSDYGLSRYVEDPETGHYSRMRAGTLAYMSPESLSSGYTLSEAIDLWALGMLALYLFTGELPTASIPDNKLKSYLQFEFGDDVRYGTLTAMISDLPSEYRLQVLPFLNGLLRLNPEERVDTGKLLMFSLFRDQRNKIPEGTLSSGLRVVVSNGAKILQTIKILEATISRYLLNVETLFLAVDIIYRCHSLTLSSEILAHTALIMSAKMVEDSPLSLKYFSNREEILQAEIKILSYLQGVIYPRALYAKARNMAELRAAYLNLVLNPRRYPDWSSNFPRLSSEEDKRAMNAADFLSLLS